MGNERDKEVVINEAGIRLIVKAVVVANKNYLESGNLFNFGATAAVNSLARQFDIDPQKVATENDIKEKEDEEKKLETLRNTYFV